MRPNRLRQLLNAGQPTLGTHMIIPWPGVIEIIGHSGMFDYVEYVGEYSPYSFEQMDNIGRAIELFPQMSSMMKIEEHARGLVAPRAVDSGIQNVLFTDCRTADDVRACIATIRAETPESGGNHGAGMRRAVGWVLQGGSQAWVEAMQAVVIAIMIEKKAAMENLDAILAVEGVDMVQFGPSDYSISMGMAGQGGHPDIQADQVRMVEKALAAGVHPRIEIGSYAQAQKWLDMGVRHFCIGWDIRTIFTWCKEQGAAMRELLAGGSGSETAGAAVGDGDPYKVK
ncbi:MAG: aldolase/citrate lyase family protein [Anaerolineae bacterium]|nr:aldolase/citrate lyase family protein [Anaerolineae bacterium]